MLRSLAKFSESEASNHAPSLADFITTMVGFKVFGTHNCILRLKPDVRLEWRGQHGQNEADQRDHRANLADSIIR